MLAMAAALLAAAVFLVLSSVTTMPVSTTHVRSRHPAHGMQHRSSREWHRMRDLLNGGLNGKKHCNMKGDEPYAPFHLKMSTLDVASESFDLGVAERRRYRCMPEPAPS